MVDLKRIRAMDGEDWMEKISIILYGLIKRMTYKFINLDDPFLNGLNLTYGSITLHLKCYMDVFLSI